jgi:small-conductance mechanosensitive channel
MRKAFLACLVSLLCLNISLKAQTDSIAPMVDTTQRTLSYQQLLWEMERQQLLDSLKRAELQQQLLLLKSGESSKKEALQQQLDALNAAETSRLQAKRDQIEALKTSTKGFPVLGFFNDTLFTLYTKLGSFSPKERAQAVTRRIEALPGRIRFEADSLKVQETENAAEVVYGETVLVSLSENDALWNETTSVVLAQNYRNIIARAVEEYKDETGLLTIAKEIGLALLVLGVIVLAVVYVSRLYRWTAQKIEAQEQKRLQGFTFRNYTVFDAKQQVRALLMVNKVLKWATILLAIYIALPILFGIFPRTQHLADTLFGYLFNPVKNILLSFWNYLPNLITILVIVFLFRYLLKALRFIKIEIERGKLTLPGFYTDWAAPTYQIVRILVIAFMFVVIFPYLPGSDSPIFKGVSVFLGFLFTFGSAGSLSNIIAGLVLTYMRLFQIGDRVKIGDVFGDVIEKSSLVTRVRTIKNEIISIPNSTVMSSHTINYSSDAPDKGLIVHTTVTIGYDVPWKEMHEALIEAAARTTLILETPAPFVLQTSLEDFYVAYQINGYTNEPNKQAVIYSELHQHIQDVCNERGIEILSPHYRAARDGNRTTIPENYLSPEYEVPGFKVDWKEKK